MSCLQKSIPENWSQVRRSSSCHPCTAPCGLSRVPSNQPDKTMSGEAHPQLPVRKRKTHTIMPFWVRCDVGQLPVHVLTRSHENIGECLRNSLILSCVAATNVPGGNLSMLCSLSMSTVTRRQRTKSIESGYRASRSASRIFAWETWPSLAARRMSWAFCGRASSVSAVAILATRGGPSQPASGFIKSAEKVISANSS